MSDEPEDQDSPSYNSEPTTAQYYKPGKWKEKAATAPAGPSQIVQLVSKGSTQPVPRWRC